MVKALGCGPGDSVSTTGVGTKLNMFMKNIFLILLLTVISIPNCVGIGTFETAETVCGDWVPINFDDRILCVSPDYYSVDGVRTPVGMGEALAIAERENAFLPTPAMVDAIWEQADIRLDPIPMTPGPQMSSVEYYQQHDRMIDQQLEEVEILGMLIAGHKKDIVQPQRPGRVTIYGWHTSNGRPIQPVSSVHGSEYRDYSHGLRLVRWPD